MEAHSINSYLKTLVLMEIMEMQQDLMGHTLVCYYKLVNLNAGLPAPKAAGYLLF
jgi:hypothetical protein